MASGQSFSLDLMYRASGGGLGHLRVPDSCRWMALMLLLCRDRGGEEDGVMMDDGDGWW